MGRTGTNQSCTNRRCSRYRERDPAVLYEMLMYPDIKSFNDDAERRNRLVKKQSVPIGPHLWWRVEQVMDHDPDNLIVLWSRPEPLPHN